MNSENKCEHKRVVRDAFNAHSALTGRDCVHGQLARSCYICELESEVVRLRLSDNGLALMLTLMAEKLALVENTLERTRQVLENDEVKGMGFVLEHNAWCPKIRSRGLQYCACGLDDTHTSLREAVAECEAVRTSLNHALAKLEVTK